MLGIHVELTRVATPFDRLVRDEIIDVSATAASKVEGTKPVGIVLLQQRLATGANRSTARALIEATGKRLRKPRELRRPGRRLCPGWPHGRERCTSLKFSKENALAMRVAQQEPERRDDTEGGDDDADSDGRPEECRH